METASFFLIIINVTIWLSIIGFTLFAFLNKKISNWSKIILRIIAIVFWVIPLYLLLKPESKPINPHIRNKIVFKDKLDAVVDSLIKMEKIIIQFPNYDNGWKEYSFDKNEVYINFKKIGTYDSLIKSQQNKVILTLHISDLQGFLRLANYLSENYIYRADYIDNKYCQFMYRIFESAGDYQTEFLRTIMLKSEFDDNMKKRFKVLDSTNALVLLAESVK